MYMHLELSSTSWSLRKPRLSRWTKPVVNSEASLVWLVLLLLVSLLSRHVLALKKLLSCFVMQFEEVFKEADKEEALRKIIDPRLGDNYPFDSVYKVNNLLLCPIRFILTNIAKPSQWSGLDGGARESLYARERAATSKYEIHCGCFIYSVLFNRKLGRRKLPERWYCQPYVWPVEFAVCGL